MKIIRILFLLIVVAINTQAVSNETSFNEWLANFKIYAQKNDISKKTLEKTMSNVIFLPKVIQYDRFQPEFYEDTKTYISKRTTNQKIKKGLILYKKNSWVLSFI